MTHSHRVNNGSSNDSSSSDDDDSSHYDTEDLAFVDTSIYTLHGDRITQNSEEAPTISSIEGDNNDENMHIRNK